MSNITWRAFEENVKKLSSFIWSCSAIKENINGVDYDCVLKPKGDYWVIVEVSENNTLSKVREDIAKFSSTRLHLFSKNIYPDCFLVINGEPTNSMITTGEGNNLKVMSYDTFANQFIDFNAYYHIRKQRVFGSAVNPFSGKPDNIDYTPVLYEELLSKKIYDLKAISKKLYEKKNIILLGNYGTGKSRCIRELYTYLSGKAANNLNFPIAINLKDNWGTKRGEEIVTRHFSDLGINDTANSIIKILDSSNLILLLDGFDEIGTQVWSDNAAKLKLIRSSSVSGVKDLIQKTDSPVIITGREHYFNSHKEMFKALGLNPLDTIFLRCKDEFSEDEMKSYLESISNIVELPFWLPRRPLICQIINTLDKKEFEKIFIDAANEVEFWKPLIQNICEREARIRSVLDADTIFDILITIAQLSRNKPGNIGPLTINELNRAFEKVVGTPPIDESAMMLQRLPALGRISSESRDRQFIDLFILDGLRAENLLKIVHNNSIEVFEEKWKNSLERFGLEIIANQIIKDKSANYYLQFLKQGIVAQNKVVSGDIFSALALASNTHIVNFEGIIIEDVYLKYLNFSISLIENFTIKDSIIEILDISNFSFSKVTFKDCIVKKVYGIKSKKESPGFLKSCDILEFEEKPFITSRNAMLISPSHMILTSLIKKLFFYMRIERKEKELLENYGTEDDKIKAKEILKILMKEKVVSRTKQNGDCIYTAKTYSRSRMNDILIKLNSSIDVIWIEASKIN